MLTQPLDHSLTRSLNQSCPLLPSLTYSLTSSFPHSITNQKPTDSPTHRQACYTEEWGGCLLTSSLINELNEKCFFDETIINPYPTVGTLDSISGECKARIACI